MPLDPCGTCLSKNCGSRLLSIVSGLLPRNKNSSWSCPMTYSNSCWRLYWHRDVIRSWVCSFVVGACSYSSIISLENSGVNPWAHWKGPWVGRGFALILNSGMLDFLFPCWPCKVSTIRIFKLRWSYILSLGLYGKRKWGWKPTQRPNRRYRSGPVPGRKMWVQELLDF